MACGGSVHVCLASAVQGHHTFICSGPCRYTASALQQGTTAHLGVAQVAHVHVSDGHGGGGWAAGLHVG